VIASGAVALIYIACAVALFADPEYRSDPTISRLAMAAVMTAGVSFVYFLGKLYCHQWRTLSPNSLLRPLVERTIVPLVATMLVPGLARVLDARQWALLAVYVGLFIALVDLPKAYANVIGTWFAEPRYGDRFFYLEYPPKRRLDMLPFDLALLALLGYLFGRHFSWG
jgi:hypothetical protein